MARKKLFKRILNSKALHFSMSLVASLLMRAIYSTCRVEKEFDEKAKPYLAGEKPAVFCFWHGRLIMAPFIVPPKRSMSVLISHHNDGALITETMLRFGIGSVRGSKKLGGAKALLALLKITETGGNIAITPDGPRGPFQKAASGAAYVAAKTGYPLVPISFSATRHWRFQSWDKFMLPKPFTRLRFTAAAPLLIHSDEDAPTATASLEASLTTLTRATDEAVGVAA